MEAPKLDDPIIASLLIMGPRILDVINAGPNIMGHQINDLLLKAVPILMATKLLRRPNNGLAPNYFVDY